MDQFTLMCDAFLFVTFYPLKLHLCILAPMTEIVNCSVTNELIAEMLSIYSSFDGIIFIERQGLSVFMPLAIPTVWEPSYIDQVKAFSGILLIPESLNRLL